LLLTSGGVNVKFPRQGLKELTMVCGEVLLLVGGQHQQAFVLQVCQFFLEGMNTIGPRLRRTPMPGHGSAHSLLTVG
jgi:hypothetical protein